MEILDVKQAASSLLFASLLVLVVFFVALRAGYFGLPASNERYPILFRQTFGIFLTYFSLAFLILPAINTALIYFVFLQYEGFSQEWIGWTQIATLFFVFICLVTYCFLIQPEARTYIFWGEGKPNTKRASKSILMGFVSFAVGYPFVLWTGIFTSLISLWIWGEAKVEQVAVKQLKMTIGHPIMFGMMIFLIVFLVPFMEELLFRGFLQSHLKRYMGRMWSLFITAFVFALIHFANSQGTGNFQLIVSLFVLSLFLGFIYERERTLWAPMALHSAFNGFSVFLIIFNEFIAI